MRVQLIVHPGGERNRWAKGTLLYSFFVVAAVTTNLQSPFQIFAQRNIRGSLAIYSRLNRPRRMSLLRHNFTTKIGLVRRGRYVIQLGGR